MGAWIIENSLVTGLVMLAVLLVCRVNRRRPALCHYLWVLAFLCLVMPPLPLPGSPGTWLRSELSDWVHPDTAAPSSLPSTLTVANVDRIPLADGGTPSEIAPAQTAPSVAAAPIEIERVRVPFTTLQWLAAIWALGALAFTGLAVYRVLAFQRVVGRAPDAPRALHSAVAQVAQRMGVRAPRIKLIEGVGSPAIWCFGRPLLLWPSQDGRALRHDGEPPLIAHELAHIARGDHWVSRIDVLAVGLCWWNPLFWVIRREVRYYAELSCDAWALWAYPTRRLVFAQALIDSQASTQSASMVIEGLCATTSDFKNFERRLNMIMNKNVSRRVSKGAATAALMTTLLVLPGFSMDDEGRDAAKDSAGGSTIKCLDVLVEAKQLSKSAEGSFQAGEYDLAIKTFKQVLALNPNDGDAHARLGYMLVGRGDYMRAARHFKTEVKLGHKVSTAIYNLSCTAALVGNPEKALALLDQSVRRGFTNTKLMAEDADLASLREHAAFDATLSAARESVELRKDAEELNMGSDLEEFVELYAILADIASEDGHVQDLFGRALLLSNDYDGGLRAFERQAAVGYAAPRAHYNMACALALAGKAEAALGELERAADLGMTNPATNEDGDLKSLHGQKRFDVVAQRLSSPKVLTKESKGYVTDEGIEIATRDLTAMIDDSEIPADRRAWAAFELGRWQVRTSQPNDAILSFQRAAEGGYEPASSAYRIGSAHASLGHVETALAYVDRSLQLGFDNADLVTKLVEACDMTDTPQGDKLVKRATSQQNASYKKKSGKKKAKYSGEWDAKKKDKNKQHSKAAKKAYKKSPSSVSDSGQH